MKKGRTSKSAAFFLSKQLNYCKRNCTGKINLTRTGLPRCSPGFHLGISLITRIASLSNDGSTPRITWISTIEPSRFTTKEQTTRPWIPFSCAITGYLMALLKYLNNSAVPPGNSGCFSTTVKICCADSSYSSSSTTGATNVSC